VHRTSGRIYKITHGEPNRNQVGDLRKLSASELVRLHTHANEWFARQARLELEARAASGEKLAMAKEQLREMFEKQSGIAIKLRALWSLYVIGATDETFLRRLLRHPD